jgi:non-ribosomal peptide synthetase component F
VSYGDLLFGSRCRAHVLASRGLEAGDVAALLVDLNAEAQGVSLVTTLLALWEAGAAVLPLNAEDPLERLVSLARAAGAGLVLAPGSVAAEAAALAAALGPQSDAESDAETGAETGAVILDSAGHLAAERAVAHQGVAARALPGARADGIAYIYFTSGTTGLPKAVPVSHGCLAAFCAGIAAAVPAGGADGAACEARVLSAASPLFDALFMIWRRALGRGAV